MHKNKKTSDFYFTWNSKVLKMTLTRPWVCTQGHVKVNQIQIPLRQSFATDSTF